MRFIVTCAFSLLLSTLFNFNICTSDQASNFAKKLRNKIVIAATSQTEIPAQTVQRVLTDSVQQGLASPKNTACKTRANHWRFVNDLRISRAPLLRSVCPKDEDLPPAFVLE